MVIEKVVGGDLGGEELTIPIKKRKGKKAEGKREKPLISMKKTTRMWDNSN